MGVRKMPGTNLYQYRFTLKGIAYAGSTGASTLREAERVEAAKRAEAKEIQRKTVAQDTPAGLSLVSAVGKYLKAQKDKPYINLKTLAVEEKAFRWIVETIGPEVLMQDLDNEMVESLVKARLSLARTNSKRESLVGANGQPQVVSASYVNRYTSLLLKRVHVMAAKRFRVPIQYIDWASDKIRLPVTGQRTREIKLEEESRILADESFRDGYGAAFQFALLTGLRKENFTRLRWSEVDFGNREIKVWVKNKRGKKEHAIRIDDELLSLLLAERGRHPTFVFTYVCQRTRTNPKSGASEVRGQRYPITYTGFTSWYRALVKRLGFDVTIHDLRRTCGSRILRYTGNLKAVCTHLGHSDVATTAKHYAHVQAADMLEILNRANEKTREAKRAVEEMFKTNSAA